jgi:hypothetical protein
VKEGPAQHKREEVTSSAATRNEEEKVAKKEKIRSRRVKQERGEDLDPQAQKGRPVRPAAPTNWQAGKGLELELTLTEHSEQTPTASKPMRGYTSARSTGASGEEGDGGDGECFDKMNNLNLTHRCYSK